MVQSSPAAAASGYRPTYCTSPAACLPAPAARAQETTFVLVKPDGIAAGVVGKVVSKLEDKGYQLKKMKTVAVSKAVAETYYGENVAAATYSTFADDMSDADRQRRKRPLVAQCTKQLIG